VLEELVGIIDIADGVAARVTAAKDLSVRAGLTFEVYPMPSTIIREEYEAYGYSESIFYIFNFQSSI
jgi:hypothetical protein